MADYSLLNWYRAQQQPQQPYGSMMSWGSSTPATAPAAAGSALPDIGADWEQMPMGTNGLAPNEGMFAGSAVNAPIGGGMNYAGGGTGQAGPVTQWLRDQGILGTRDAQGWGGLALGGAQALGGLYLGMKQYNLAKEALAASKSQFERNFANQVKNTNTALEDRQRARVASNAGAYQSVGDYMNDHKVS